MSDDRLQRIVDNDELYDRYLDEAKDAADDVQELAWEVMDARKVIRAIDADPSKAAELVAQYLEKVDT